MKTSQVQGTLFVISAPSGAGKTSLVAAMLEQDPLLCVSVSHTTRAQRAGERDGVDYHFVETDRFQAMIGEGVFLEYAEVFGNYYGTSQQWVRQALSEGRDVILEIDWQGAAQIRRLMPECVGIFILPPSRQVLRSRLEGRGKDSADVIEKRLAKASEECSHALEFDYVVVNDDFQLAVADLLAITRTQRLGVNRQQVRHRELLADLAGL